jgi:hypothetical protein
MLCQIFSKVGKVLEGNFIYKHISVVRMYMLQSEGEEKC